MLVDMITDTTTNTVPTFMTFTAEKRRVGGSGLPTISRRQRRTQRRRRVN